MLGASGFVGSHVVSALIRRGAEVTAVRAPRLSTSARSVPDLRGELEMSHVKAESDRLRAELAGASTVINAAGLAHATGGGDDLFGANALLPAVVAEAMEDGARLVHVSSAAVQGRMSPLDESNTRAPFSPYSASKALGEELVAQRADTVCFRPTSVHGPDRQVTRSLSRLVSSRVASVAGRGDGPTPQVLVDNVADAVAFIALTQQIPPAVVLQPHEGLTVAGLVRSLGGREPLHVATWLARPLVRMLSELGSVLPPIAGVARRLEMLWFGQHQVDGWLTTTDWSAPESVERWKDMM
ncbi:NAD-dependent epimerase/dehydratase family protein [Nocardioides terrigena]|uniref:NAD-dependent epimerase/dehydratase family protein n=1 Tax=Nocardioides terrigena TaxID=424797 RepID=UPI002279138D|nr:NAD-dependent epimerase/dehydratase family protein [Nocardioides terrigena]